MVTIISCIGVKILHVLVFLQGVAGIIAANPANRPSPIKLNFVIDRNRQLPGLLLENRNIFTESISAYKDIDYRLDLFLGSNKQKVNVKIDTGSADLWVPEVEYNLETSATCTKTWLEFSSSFLTGYSVKGEYFVDRLELASGGVVLPEFQFARVETDKKGILGLSDRKKEATLLEYDNLPWALQKAGLIETASYSLYLGSDRQTGSLILGGIDTEKFHGDLKTYQINRNAGTLAIDLKSVNFNGLDVPVNAPYELDSGTSLGLLPSDLMNELDLIFNPIMYKQGAVHYRRVSCDQPSDEYLEFNFGENTIRIPYSEAIVEAGNDTCILGFGWSDNHQILGDVFLRHAYVFFDLGNQTISLAQASL